MGTRTITGNKSGRKLTITSPDKPKIAPSPKSTFNKYPELKNLPIGKGPKKPVQPTPTKPVQPTPSKGSGSFKGTLQNVWKNLNDPNLDFDPIKLPGTNIGLKESMLMGAGVGTGQTIGLMEGVGSATQAMNPAKLLTMNKMGAVRKSPMAEDLAEIRSMEKDLPIVDPERAKELDRMSRSIAERDFITNYGDLAIIHPKTSWKGKLLENAAQQKLFLQEGIEGRYPNPGWQSELLENAAQHNMAKIEKMEILTEAGNRLEASKIMNDLKSMGTAGKAISGWKGDVIEESAMQRMFMSEKADIEMNRRIISETMDKELTAPANELLMNPNKLSAGSSAVAAGRSMDELRAMNSAQFKTLTSWITKIAKNKYVLGTLSAVAFGYIGAAPYLKSMAPNDYGDKLTTMQIGVRDAIKRGDYETANIINSKLLQATDPETMKEFLSGEPITKYFKGAIDKIDTIGEVARLTQESIEKGQHYQQQDERWSKYAANRMELEKEILQMKEEQQQRYLEALRQRDEEQRRYQQERDEYYENLRTQQAEEEDKKGRGKLGFGLL